MKKIIFCLLFAMNYSFCFTQEKDSLQRLGFCTCDSIKPFKSDSVFHGDGYARLYNMDKQLSSCGYYKNYRIIYGLRYIYDKEHKLIGIEKIINGKKIGECENKPPSKK